MTSTQDEFKYALAALFASAHRVIETTFNAKGEKIEIDYVRVPTTPFRELLDSAKESGLIEGVR